MVFAGEAVIKSGNSTERVRTAKDIERSVQRLFSEDTFVILEAEGRDGYAQAAEVIGGPERQTQFGGKYVVEHRRDGSQYQTATNDLARIGALLTAWLHAPETLDRLADWKAVPI